MVLGSIALLPSTIFAVEYQLLAPIPEAGFTSNPANNFGSYAASLIRLIIGAATVLAIIMFIFGGFAYMTSESLSAKGAGRETMMNAVGGLVLLLASYLILNTINPNLLNLNLNINKVAQLPQQNNSTIGLQELRDQQLRACEQRYDNNPSLQNTVSRNEYVSACTNISLQDPILDNVLVPPPGNNPLNPNGEGRDCNGCTAVSIPIKNLNACRLQNRTPCMLNTGYQEKLRVLLQNARLMNLEGEISEAWPPSVDHVAYCHDIGTCSDIHLIGGNEEKNLQTIVTAAKAAGLIVVYEGSDAVTGANSLKADFSPHFSVYQSLSDCQSAYAQTIENIVCQQ